MRDCRSGDHEELKRANGDADGDQEDTDGDGKKARVSRVYRYTFMLPSDNNVTVPMFTICYEELYNTALTEVTCIRIWKMVFDEKHSDSELWRKLMDENQTTFASAGVAHTQNAQRRKNLVAEQKQNRVVTGGVLGRTNLEYYAGTQYSRVTNESVLLETLKAYGGRNMHGDGKPVVNYDDLPPGLLCKRITPNTKGLGGTHPLSPEFLFNAKRQMAFTAGQIDFEDNPLDIHPDFLDNSKYFTDSGDFTLPDVSKRMGGFFFVIDPSLNNIFDASLPRSIYGSVCAGPNLLQLFKDEMVEESSVSNASLSDRFNNMMTKKDAEHAEMERQAAETVISYDSIDCSEMERKSLRHYGDMAGSDSYVIEPRQIMKDIQRDTRQVQSQLIEPWKKKRDIVRDEKNRELRTKEGEDSDMMDVEYHDERLKELHDLEDETEERHCAVVKDLVYLHVNRIESAFRSKMERETIPAGYIAMFDGLQDELAKMPNGTASVAFAHNNKLIASDISMFAHIHMWLGEFFEKDCFIEGRDRRLMDEIFLHLFEQYGDVTFLMLLCGYKGNGKTLRTERAEKVFPPNWVTMGGPSSAKAGMNGQSDNNNGKNVVYDEMVGELCDSEGSDRLEYWKQIVLKREYIFQRTIPLKNPDGTESHKTMKLRTPHDETHLICTNYGMAYTKNGEPSDTKFAMIDRTVAHLVRSIGKNAHTDIEFNEHMAKPEQQKKLTQFRIFVCLVGATKLCIKGVPSFQPNLALANKIYDHLDNNMIVGEYNLPRRSARKSLKREENLRTMCVMNAVGNVFMYKQTAVEFEAGRLGSDGLPQPFRWSMLYDVIRQLRPTPEIIFKAWSESLDYNIGTAAHTFAAMTAVCEAFDIKIGDWMKKPPTDEIGELVGTSDVRSPSFAHSNPPPEKTEGMSDEEYKRALDTWSHTSDLSRADDAFKELAASVSSQGVSREERIELLQCFERNRRATAQYRARCAMDGNSDITMDDPVRVIENIMSNMAMPSDMGADAAGGSSDQYMPLYPSCIVAGAVQISIMHRPQALVQWCSGGAALKQEIGPCTQLGTAPGKNFRKRKGNGACQWDTAWMRHPRDISGWMGFSREIIDKNHTCKIFDIPLNGLRDLMYLLSTKDNARRCTEEPKLPHTMTSQMAFEDHRGNHVSDTSLHIRMRGIHDSRNRGNLSNPGQEALPRHPYSKVPNVALQRSLDYAVNAGRFPAIMPVVSNNVTTMAPVRLVFEDGKQYVELNTAAAFDHTKMMTEAVLRCSVHPGMENEQEYFCDNMQGPEGLCASGGADPGEGMATKLPYSYDIMSISLTMDAMSRYFDPVGREYCDMFREAFGESLGFDVTFEKLPHMCMRFVGFQEDDRRLLSMKIPEKRNPVFGYVEAGDIINEKSVSKATVNTVSLSLGHNASDEEVARYLKSRAGSRAMSGVVGELFSMETWIKHQCTALKERGMVSGQDDVVIHMVTDDPYGLRQRVAELASAEINKIIDRDLRMKAADKELPGDSELSPEKLREVKLERKRKVRNDLYECVKLPEHLEDLRHYGPLNLESDCVNMTYQNTATIDKENRATSNDKKHEIVNAASQYADVKRIQKNALPGQNKKRRTEHGVHGRGRKDTRG